MQGTPPSPEQQMRSSNFSKNGILSFLLFICLLLLLFTGLLVRSIPQLFTSTATPTLVRGSMLQAQQNEESSTPLSIPGSSTPTTLLLPQGRYLLYEQQNDIYYVPITGGTPQSILTPGYIYNNAVPPIITPSGQLLYSGDGIWLTNIFTGAPTQIATLPPGQIITSMVLSSDGSTLAWSTEPIDGSGTLSLYAGPLTLSQLVYQQPASECPCFRAFAFLSGTSIPANTFLMITDDRGDHNGIRSGLWLLNVRQLTANEPTALLPEDSQQGPLTMMPQSNVLLYSSAEGVVPEPTDNSVPQELSALNYANSLDITTIMGKSPTLQTTHTILPGQGELSNSANYRWVATPHFSADGHTLVYLEFSSDAQKPFDRHYAIYSAQVTVGTHGALQTNKPKLLATSSADFMELGSWVNNHIITFYADNTLYALNVQTGALATIIQTVAYARAVAVVGQGLI